MSDEDVPAIVIDNGSSSIKAGIAREMAPKVVFPTVVGKTTSGVSVGDEAVSKKDIVSLNYPIDRGLVTNWDDMETIWHHTFKKALQVAPEERRVMLTEPPANTKANREQMTQIMFESLNSAGVYIVNQGILSLYAAGLLDGVFVSLGDGYSHIASVSQGYCVPNSSIKIDLAGRDLTNYLAETLKTKADKETVRDIKEKHCFVSINFEDEKQTAESNPSLKKSYQLPDGQSITIGDERFRCPEALFKPNFLGIESTGGIHELTRDSINKCDEKLRETLYENIILAGGSSMIPGIAERVQKEMTSLAAPSIGKVDVRAPEHRKFSAWIGGSIMASMAPTMNAMWITKQEYEEVGKSIVHKKCVAV